MRPGKRLDTRSPNSAKPAPQRPKPRGGKLQTRQRIAGGSGRRSDHARASLSGTPDHGRPNSSRESPLRRPSTKPSSGNPARGCSSPETGGGESQGPDRTPAKTGVPACHGLFKGCKRAGSSHWAHRPTRHTPAAVSSATSDSRGASTARPNQKSDFLCGRPSPQPETRCPNGIQLRRRQAIQAIQHRRRTAEWSPAKRKLHIGLHTSGGAANTAPRGPPGT